ncbi:XRE family transcriptional regulator [Oenococcus oeni]|uniref:Rgg/GadR/MutR family transcriptional regulator n=1 Tax=Oenococcus oeni TaxID=1247 RepID=UPI000BDF0817|nr:Rgg/GadR/MutR family transcriptional regulator [Oenococcus oeni]PDH90144.1 XRE family transcriptional regulator [Oenococcus oeni]PDH91115.1 XRE family transcriptional regulator [Oenococcus oeni]
MDKNTVNQAGIVFQKLRKQRHLSTKKLAKGILSVSSVNKFETGKTKLSFFKLGSLLKRMDISLDDYYEQIESETLSDSYNHFLNKIEPIYQGNDLLTLKAIAKEETSKNNEEFINLIKTASLISFIKKIDSNYLVEDMIVKKISQYLMSVEYWNSFELVILKNCLIILTCPMIKVLSKELIYLSAQLNDRNRSDNFLSAITNMVDILYRREDYQSAKELLFCLEKISLNQDQLVIKFKISFMRNLLTLTNQKAKRANRQLIKSLRSIDSNYLASSYESYMDKYMVPDNS